MGMAKLRWLLTKVNKMSKNAVLSRFFYVMHYLHQRKTKACQKVLFVCISHFSQTKFDNVLCTRSLLNAAATILFWWVNWCTFIWKSNRSRSCSLITISGTKIYTRTDMLFIYDMYIYTGIFSETERVGTQFHKLFLGGTQVGTAFQTFLFLASLWLTPTLSDRI